MRLMVRTDRGTELLGVAIRPHEPRAPGTAAVGRSPAQAGRFGVTRTLAYGLHGGASMKAISLLRPHFFPLLGLCALVPALGGCSSTDTQPIAAQAGQPTGPVAHDAAEAWPTKPNVAVLAPESVARACAAWSSCSTPNGTTQARLTAAAVCTAGVVWSAERAIPMSDIFLGDADERAELFVKCAIDHDGDCGALATCLTKRSAAIYCEEDGCKAQPSLQVTCAGSVATLSDGSSTKTRDCARAFAACDATSPTGCTDRHFTACPADGDRADRCDGEVRLGCDGSDQVSYHDCARLGGTCGAIPGGGQGCVYPGPDQACASGAATSQCNGSDLSICVGTRLVTVAAPALCAKAP